MADSDSTSEEKISALSTESSRPKTGPSELALTVEPRELEDQRQTGSGSPVDDVSPTDKERQEAATDWQALQDMMRSIPQIKTYSMAKSIAIGLLGPTVRIWRKDNVVSFGYDKGNQRFILGEAKDYTNALKLVMFTLASAKARTVNKGLPIGQGQQGQVGEEVRAEVGSQGGE